MNTVLRVALLLIITVLVCEVALRVLGFKTNPPSAPLIKAFAPVSPIVPDSLTGFSLSQGTYTYSYENGYSFVASHDINGCRRSSYDTVKKNRSINFYGCSFFYGFGLCDSSVFTWKLSRQLTNYKVNNYSVFGNNMVTPLLLLQKQIKEGTKPEIAVISYSSFNLSRNIYALSFRKQLSVQSKIIREQPLKYVSARSNTNGTELTMQYSEIRSSGFPLAKISVAMSRCEEVYMKLENYRRKPLIVDSLLIENYIKLCRENNIQLVFAFITKDEHSSRVMSSLTARGVNCLDLFVDFSDKRYNLMPNDNHCNDAAHTLYAQKVMAYLDQKGFLTKAPSCSVKKSGLIE